MNHFPGAFHLGRKDRLWQHLYGNFFYKLNTVMAKTRKFNLTYFLLFFMLFLFSYFFGFEIKRVEIEFIFYTHRFCKHLKSRGHLAKFQKLQH